MWIQSPTLGGFSIVLADDLATGRPDPATVMIRARDRRHLVRLQAAAPALSDYAIVGPESGLDYPCRLVCPKAAFAEALRTITLELAYRNVKNEAHRHEDALGRGFVSALHRVHADLASAQPRP